jgi:DNA repair protein RecN (Recombination protein N)
MVEKALDLSARHQIICITHLAQIAKFARHHYKISKHEELEHLKFLCSTEDRLEETAR